MIFVRIDAKRERSTPNLVKKYVKEFPSFMIFDGSNEETRREIVGPEPSKLQDFVKDYLQTMQV